MSSFLVELPCWIVVENQTRRLTQFTLARFLRYKDCGCVDANEDGRLNLGGDQPCRLVECCCRSCCGGRCGSRERISRSHGSFCRVLRRLRRPSIRYRSNYTIISPSSVRWNQNITDHNYISGWNKNMGPSFLFRSHATVYEYRDERFKQFSFLLARQSLFFSYCHFIFCLKRLPTDMRQYLSNRIEFD